MLDTIQALIPARPDCSPLYSSCEDGEWESRNLWSMGYWEVGFQRTFDNPYGKDGRQPGKLQRNRISGSNWNVLNPNNYGIVMRNISIVQN